MPEFIRQSLMLPGPTPMPPSVLKALATPMINHRGSEWSQLFQEVMKGVQWAYQTQNEVLAITGSGTPGLEAAMVNTLSPGDHILVLINGVFGERGARIAEAFGVQAERMVSAPGQAVDLNELEARLKADTDKRFKVVWVTHNETSTGVLNPLEQIASLVHDHGAMIIVDAISSLLSTALPVDDWKLDVVVSGSQKAFMIPPGLSFLSVSERALEAHKTSKIPKFSLDFKHAREFAKNGQTPWTPPISLFYAMKESLRIMQEEGLSNIMARHYQMMKAVRAGVQALGLQPLVTDEAHASRAVTSIYPPDAIAADDLRKAMATHFNIVLAGGQQEFKGKIFRVGHLGYQSLQDIFAALAAMESCLSQLGHEVEFGASIAAAHKALRQ